MSKDRNEVLSGKGGGRTVGNKQKRSAHFLGRDSRNDVKRRKKGFNSIAFGGKKKFPLIIEERNHSRAWRYERREGGSSGKETGQT